MILEHHVVLVLRNVPEDGGWAPLICPYPLLLLLYDGELGRGNKAHAQVSRPPRLLDGHKKEAIT